jgi:hypothetical protein
MGTINDLVKLFENNNMFITKIKCGYYRRKSNMLFFFFNLSKIPFNFDPVIYNNYLNDIKNYNDITILKGT